MILFLSSIPNARVLAMRLLYLVIAVASVLSVANADTDFNSVEHEFRAPPAADGGLHVLSVEQVKQALADVSHAGQTIPAVREALAAVGKNTEEPGVASAKTRSAIESVQHANIMLDVLDGVRTRLRALPLSDKRRLRKILEAPKQRLEECSGKTRPSLGKPQHAPSHAPPRA